MAKDLRDGLIGTMTSIWALEERALENLIEAGRRVDATSRLALRLEEQKAGYESRGDVAVIRINGVITPEPTLWGSLFGGEATHGYIRNSIKAALRDEEVRQIVLSFDSPGGIVTGIQGLADFVADASDQKPVHAHTEGLMLSGAYFLGSQADEVVISPEGEVGSIGVLIAMYDWSKAFESNGIHAYAIASGPLKGTGLLGTELTEEQRTYLQQIVDDTAVVFKRAVANGRALKRKDVERLADGSSLVGQRALAAGLADRVLTLDQLVVRLGGMKQLDNQMATTAAELEESTMSKKTDMAVEDPQAATVKELKAAFPDSDAEFREACLEAEMTLAQAKDAWLIRLAEQKRELEEGKTTLTEQLATLRAENERLKAARPGGEKELSLTVPHGGEEDELSQLRGEARWQAEWDRSEELQAEFDGNKAAYLAYQRAAKRGQVRIVGNKAS